MSTTSGRAAFEAKSPRAFPAAAFLIAISLAVGTTLSGCTSMTNEPLFERLGGESGLEALADAFLIRLAEDEVVVATFDDTDIDQFRGHLIDQLCELSGGPCTYEGRTMAEAHSGLNISPKQFNSLVEVLMQAMADVDIPLGARNELLGMLAPMYHDTIGG